MLLANKTAVVTGASKGIGAGIAKHLAAAGATVVVNYSSSQTDAAKVVEEITALGGKAIALHANVSKPEEVNRLFAQAGEALGPLDILVNNAGVFNFAPLGGITPDHFHRMFDINVLGTILAIQEALKHFNPAGGSIINVSSLVSRDSPAGCGTYNATKGAVDALTRTFAKELGSRRIRVNSINPGPVETDGVHAQGLIGTFQSLGARTLLGRIGQPGDIAAGVVYLASDASSWMTGECLHINGGVP